MKMLIINGSPRMSGNTSALVRQLIKNMRGTDIEAISIFEKDIKGCRNCGACQKTTLESHCTIDDDMHYFYSRFLSSDIIVLASPIYMWQFTPCTIAFLNRLHCLCRSSDFSYNDMKGKKMAALITMGDEEDVAGFAVNGLTEFCKFFQMSYEGDVRIPFAEKEKISSGEYDTEIKEFIAKILR